MQRRVGRSVQTHSGLEHCGGVLRCAAVYCCVLHSVAMCSSGWQCFAVLESGGLLQPQFYMSAVLVVYRVAINHPRMVYFGKSFPTKYPYH